MWDCWYNKNLLPETIHAPHPKFRCLLGMLYAFISSLYSTDSGAMASLPSNQGLARENNWTLPPKNLWIHAAEISHFPLLSDLWGWALHLLQSKIARDILFEDCRNELFGPMHLKVEQSWAGSPYFLAVLVLFGRKTVTLPPLTPPYNSSISNTSNTAIQRPFLLYRSENSSPTLKIQCLETPCLRPHRTGILGL